jgi:hypothetical protein
MDLFKKAAFSMIPMLALFAMVEAGLWMTGFQPGTDKADPYVGFAAGIPLFIEVEGQGQRVMRTASNKRDFFNDQSFPREKSHDAKRIFCMGGSTTYGRPYRDVTSFCAWLRVSLERLDPDTRWEVINAGGISYATARARPSAHPKLGCDGVTLCAGWTDFECLGRSPTGIERTLGRGQDKARVERWARRLSSRR